MEQEIFFKYFTGTISPQEETELLVWIEASDANREEYIRQRKVWDMYLLNRAPEEPSIGFTQVLAEHNRKLMKKAPKVTAKPVIWMRELMKVAAVFIVAFGIAWYFYNTREQEPLYNTVEVPSGQRVKLTLPDGSLVWLNAQTKLTYPALFDKDTREVILDGEGLFEVAHRANHPFKVQTPRHEVIVTGTTFDVYAYSNSDAFETILIEGAVSVSDMQQPGKVYPVQPGCKLFYNEETEQMEMHRVNTNDYILWKDGIYFFNDISFAEMAKRLGHYYKTNIIINDSSVMNYRGTGKFRQHESITDIMDVVKSDMPFKYRYDKDANELIIEKVKSRR